MLKTYVTLAWRHLRKNRGYTFINIAGLSFDHYSTNHRRLAVGMLTAHLPNATKKDEFFAGDGSSRLYRFGDKTVIIMRHSPGGSLLRPAPGSLRSPC